MRGVNWKIGAWTPAEDDVLFAHYESSGVSEVSRITGRTRFAVHNRARYFGLKANAQAVRLYLASK